jgi:hypothetical protein
MKEHFRSLSQINTVSVSVELSIDILTQMEQSFISKELTFWVKSTAMYYPQKPVIKLDLLSYLNLPNFIQH